MAWVQQSQVLRQLSARASSNAVLNGLCHTSPRLRAMFGVGNRTCFWQKRQGIGCNPYPPVRSTTSCQTCGLRQIWEAFVAFDLDKNKFVGAAEIRHVLVNIGEQVRHQHVKLESTDTTWCTFGLWIPINLRCRNGISTRTHQRPSCSGVCAQKMISRCSVFLDLILPNREKRHLQICMAKTSPSA